MNDERIKLNEYRICKSTDMFFSDNLEFEEDVIKEMFLYALESKPRINTIYIYCGRMSVFRDTEHNTEMIEKMIEFFNNDGWLKIIVDEHISSIVDEPVWRNILRHYFFNTEQLKIKELIGGIGINHYAVCGDAIFLENSHEDKNGTGCFNEPDHAKILYNNFISIEKYSKPVTL